MRVLITGSEGCLGKVLKQKLRDQGHSVYGCDLLHSSDPQVMRADVSERRQLTRVYDFVQPQVVYGLAAEFGRRNGADYFEQLFKSNMTGTQNMIEECLRTRSVLAFASSSEAYGMADLYAKPDEHFHESWLDDYAPQFNNLYSLTKWANERQIYMAARNDGLKAVMFRFFNVYGPGEVYSPYRSVVCLFTYSLLAGLPITVYKDSYRSHLYVSDWADTVSRVADWDRLDRLFSKKIWNGSGESGVPVFNIGSPEFESAEYTLNKIIKAVGSYKSKITTLASEAANISQKRPSLFTTETYLDHYPKVTMEQGIEKTVAWMKETYGF